MKNILIIFTHPRLENSKTNTALIDRIPEDCNITFHDLYERYPDFNIDIEHEKNLLLKHDIIIWQHPLYWYSSPPLLKQWIDMVLQFGWAYGQGENRLQGKIVFNAITTGGTQEAYSLEGYHHHTLKEFLLPFSQTAGLCGMIYLPPFAVQGTHRISQEELSECADRFYKLLYKLAHGEIKPEQVTHLNTLNEYFIHSPSINGNQ